MIIDRIENWRERWTGPTWNKVFEALEQLGLDTPEGETILQDDEMIMRVMSYATRGPDEAVLETHRKYIDIQMALDGSERIDWFPATGLEVKTPYNEQKDAVYYRRPGTAPAHVDVFPGTFAVLFPTDAHMPQLMTGPEPGHVKKVVIKLSVDLVKP